MLDRRSWLGSALASVLGLGKKPQEDCSIAVSWDGGRAEFPAFFIHIGAFRDKGDCTISMAVEAKYETLVKELQGRSNLRGTVTLKGGVSVAFDGCRVKSFVPKESDRACEGRFVYANLVPT